MISISTKTGDDGTTGLANGKRVPKDALLVEVIGTLDELSSWIGLVAAHCGSEFPLHRTFLLEIQETMFHIGAELALSPKTKLTTKPLKLLENAAQEVQSQMEDGWHSKFLFPGGSILGAYLDVTRTVSRRLERRVVALSREQPVSDLILQYLNRLSDYLYVLRCFVNHAVAYPEQQFERTKSKK
ncbi:cob(I)yrinic acid a,c-diamide adenosyltransferase [Candidatus Woesebacteria bacterium]|nr:cob(I)yrinic acid a,c-diamide adenosyltransferase [Candidatus Woesebacteria bacterium]